MSRRTHLAALGAAAILAACSERTSPDPIPDQPDDTRSAAVTVVGAHAARERLARRLALALGDPQFRARLKHQLDRSPAREGKLHFQRFLAAANQQALRDLARHGSEADAAVGVDARSATSLELYLPVKAHRLAWRGDERILVATAHADRERPVAFTTAGRRFLLDPDQPPATPVLALVPVETDFAGAEPGTDRPVEDPPPPPPPPPSGPPAGLYMTYSHFVDDFEGWLKGGPEFEVHMLGQLGATDSLTSYSCAGANAGGYYRFDQNEHDWSGSVLLATQTQLNAYKAAHPNQNMRVFVVEDDDTSCQIKADVNRFASLVKAVEVAYPRLAGGRDTTRTTLQRWWRSADALQKLYRALASFIKTNDELVGNAVESAVTGVFYPNANWVVKGDGNRTNGWINLEMKR